MTVLTKGQLIDIYAEQKEVTKVAAKKELEAIFDFFDGVVVDYQAGFQFGNLGKFEVDTVAAKEARKGRHPQSGEEIEIAAVPEHLGFKFKPSKGKESVREKLKNA